MKLFAIQFAPLLVPTERRLQTVAAATWFVTLAFGGPLGSVLAIYLIFFTRLWWLTLLYIAWIIYEKDICEHGGRRRSYWVSRWLWWAYLRDYFPLRLEKVFKEPLDPKRNYLFCCFPHGMFSAGVFHAFGTRVGEFSELFPDHDTKVVTLHQHYTMPFFRELALSIGGISSTAKSISYVLSRPEGGQIVTLMPGGAAEAYYCHPGQYKILLKKRKGFIKLALQHGSPLVPVVSFGKTDLFEQMDGPKLRKFQEFVRNYVGITPVIPLGRGFFQYSFGIIPQRKQVTTVVGTPVEVQKIEHPTKEEIEELHAKFTQALVDLFEKEKYKYLKNAQDIHLDM